MNIELYSVIMQLKSSNLYNIAELYNMITKEN